MKIKEIILFSSICILAACSGNEKPVDLSAAVKTAKTTSLYETTPIKEKAMSSSARLPGQLKAFNEVNLFPKVNGFVKKLYVDRGTVVRKGQLLVTLEAPEMEAQLQSASSRYLQARENAAASKEKYLRLMEAAKEAGAVSPLELDNARAKMKADEAMTRSENANVSAVRTLQGYLNIRAPFDGMIVQRNVSPGALVAPGKETDLPMLVLQDIRKLRLEVYIPENFVDQVDLKQAVSFTFNAIPGKAQLGYISRSANALGSMRSEAIEIDVSNADGALKPGMYAEVSIPMRSGAKSLLVPNNAIVRSTEREYVIAVNQGKADLIDIKEGLSKNDSTEVFGKLNAGNLILKNANDEIKPGTKIR